MKPFAMWALVLSTLVLLLPACTDATPSPAPMRTVIVATATPIPLATIQLGPDVTPTPCIPCKPRGAGEPDLVVTRPMIDQRGVWTHYVNVNDYRVVLAAGETLWAGTNQGLFQWDDQGQWQRFAVEDGLPSNRVTALARAADGTLWVGTDRGLARRLLDDDWVATATPAGVRSLAVDAQGRVWAALDEGQGLVRLDADGQLRRIAKEVGFPDDDVRVVAKDVQGCIWCGTASGVSVFDRTAWRVFEMVDMGLEDGEPVTAIALNRQGHAWVRAGELVAHCDGTFWRVYPSIYEAVTATFEAVRDTINSNGLWHVDVGGNVWLQGIKRVEIYDGEHWSPQPFTAHHARTIASDAKGHLWLGTDGAGLLRVTPDDERILYVLNGPPANQIVAVATAGDRTVWCGTIQADVGVLSNETWTVYDGQNSLLRALVIDSIATDLGGTWVETDELLYRFRDGQWTAYESVWQAVESEYVILVATASIRGPHWLSDGQGNVWAWEGAVLGRYDGSAWQRYTVDANGEVKLTRVARDVQGRLWCGTYENGLGVFDPQTAQWTFHTSQNSPLESRHVVDVLAAGDVWLSTASVQKEPGSGLYCIAPDGTWRHWGQEEGLPSLDLGDLVADGRGRVWAECPRGLVCVDENGVVTAFTMEDGLLSNQVTSLALDGAGRLWVGTWDGLCRYDPNLKSDDR